MSQQLRSRLDITGRAAFNQSQAPPSGFKVLVTNLQTSVTEEDIKVYYLLYALCIV
jgi:RNA recognition motif-containing protein